MKDRSLFQIRFQTLQAKKYDQILMRELEANETSNFSSYLKDNRTKEQYLYDIIEGWYYEEQIELCIMSKLSEPFERQGCDANRTIRPTDKVTSKPDYKIGPLKLEIQISNTKREDYDIKESKAKALKREGGLILFYIVPEDKYFIVNNRMLEGSKAEPNPRWKGKPCHKIQPERLFTKEQIVQGLQQVLNKRLGVT